MIASSTFATDLIPHHELIVLCGRADDAAAWAQAMQDRRVLAVGLDPLAMQELDNSSPTAGIAWHHSIIAAMDHHEPLASRVSAFDPNGVAIVIAPDPLDPPAVGRRQRIGGRRALWRMFEDKTVVDALWDALGIPRPTSIIADLTSITDLAHKVNEGNGVVCGVQRRGEAPSGGGEGIRWWRDQPPQNLGLLSEGRYRLRLMPLLAGTPMRLHGLVLPEQVIVFPPRELVTLPRADRGTFLCCGSAATLPHLATLNSLTEDIGSGLRETIEYRGAFSVDGVLTAAGFRPTDLNTRLTSAIEATPPRLRVQLQALNVLARSGVDINPASAADLARQAFQPNGIHTLYGAASQVDESAPTSAHIRWHNGTVAETDVAHADGRIRIAPSLRRWTATIELKAAQIPSGLPLGLLAPELFMFCDRFFGTDFGILIPPAGIALGLAEVR